MLSRVSSFGETRQSLETSDTRRGDQPSEQATTVPTAGQRVVTIAREPRRRNKAHLQFVASQPCLLCGRRPSDAHHLRFAQSQTMSRKVSDEFTVPLCRTHHRQIHRFGREAEWWQANKPDIDPLKIAKELWDQTRNGLLSPQTLC
jgi:hypothetical protein